MRVASTGNAGGGEAEERRGKVAWHTCGGASGGGASGDGMSGGGASGGDGQ